MEETLEVMAAELQHGHASSVGLVKRAFERIEAAFGADDQLLAFAREVSDAIPPSPLPQFEAAL